MILVYQIKFSHRNQHSAYEDNLKWELVFSCENVDYEIDDIESYDVVYDIDVNRSQRTRRNWSSTVASVSLSRPPKSSQCYS